MNIVAMEDNTTVTMRPYSAISGGNGIPALIVIALSSVFLHFLFGFLLKAPTAEGRRRMDEIEGLKLYLGVAERDELKSLPGPGEPPALDAQPFALGPGRAGPRAPPPR
mgnify:CR=1 FL=1